MHVRCNKGDFGVVYRGNLTGQQDGTTTTLVALKILKGKIEFSLL